jgi:hypothetical protein
MRGGFGGHGHRHHFRQFGGGFGPGQQQGGPGGFGPGQRWGGPGGFGPGNFERGPGGGPGPQVQWSGHVGSGGPGFFLASRGFGGPGGPPDPAKMTDAVLNHLTQALTLTDDQKAKIKPIIEQQVADIQKQMEAQRQAMQKEIEDAKTQIKPILNADQQKQLDAIPIPGQKPPDAAPPPAAGN